MPKVSEMRKHASYRNFNNGQLSNQRFPLNKTSRQGTSTNSNREGSPEYSAGNSGAYPL